MRGTRLDLQFELFAEILRSGRLRAKDPPGVEPGQIDEELPVRTVTFAGERGDGPQRATSTPLALPRPTNRARRTTTSS